MNGYTVDLHSAGAGAGDEVGVGLIGGKGIGLRRLAASGYSVPAGFVITTTAYQEAVAAAGLVGAEPERLRAELPQLEVPAAITAEILTSYRELTPERVAVRSSATAEDLEGASFAGQYDTYLSIGDGPAVLDAVRQCWASLWTERAVEYRMSKAGSGAADGDDVELAMAVVVQAMVPAEWAGVMFTVDPVSGRRDRLVLEAVPGLGEALVSGEATGVHLSFDKSAGTFEPTDGGPDRSVLQSLADLGVAVERDFGGPQDLEWAYADGRCWLLQARPLTALPDEARRSRFGSFRGKRARTPRPNPYAITADHLSQPPYPMDLALFVRPTVGAILAAFRSAGLDVPAVSQVVVEIDDGVVQIVPPKPRLTPRVLIGIPASVPKVVRLLSTKTRAWRERCDQTLIPLARRLDTTDLSVLTDRQLLDGIDELFATTGRLTPSRFGAVPIGAAADVAAKQLLRRVVGVDRADELSSDLMADLDCVTARANAELGRLAEIIRSDPQLRAVYEEAGPTGIGDRLAGFEEGRRLLTGIDGYLAINGYRELVILTVGQPTLRDRPDVVHGLLKGLTATKPTAGPEPGARSRGAWVKLSAAPGPAATITRPVIRKLVDVARDRAAFREDTDYLLAMVPAVARRLLLELGGRKVDRGELDHPDDIVFLEPAELGLPAERVRALVARRRQARASALAAYSAVPAEFLRTSQDGAVRGTPASPGSYTGIVRVVREPSEFSRLQPGEVLVCPYTNPMWTPLFGVAGAVVVDSGGAASHAAIVAREYGIPAVMGTGNATATLADGQRVRVDADRGTVTVLGARRTPSAARTP